MSPLEENGLCSGTITNPATAPISSRTPMTIGIASLRATSGLYPRRRDSGRSAARLVTLLAHRSSDREAKRRDCSQFRRNPHQS